MSKMTVTNFEFADRVGVHYTMASRLRNGDRLPGTETLIAVINAFELDCDQVMAWLDAIDEGPKASGRWLRANIFETDDADPAVLPAAG